MKSETRNAARRLAGLLKHVAEGERLRAQREPAARRGGERSAEDARIEIRAAELTRLRDRLRELPDVRADLVASVRAELEDGRYCIDPERLADEMLDETRCFTHGQDDADDDR